MIDLDGLQRRILESRPLLPEVTDTELAALEALVEGEQIARAPTIARWKAAERDAAAMALVRRVAKQVTRYGG